MTRLLPLVLLLVLAPGPIQADERGLETRILDVGALTRGFSHFTAVAPPPVQHKFTHPQPLFGGESDERSVPVGSPDELIELVRTFVPETWEELVGANIATLANDRLVVRTKPDVLDAVERTLADLERQLLPAITVDVRALRLTHALAARLGKTRTLDGGQVDALLASPAAGPGITVTATSGQQVTAHSGTQRAFVSDYQPDVSQKANVSQTVH